MSDALLALSSLPSMYPARLRHLLAHHDPDDLLGRLRDGRLIHPEAANHIRGDGLDCLRSEARRVDPAGVRASCDAAGIGVVGRGDPRLRAILADDPAPPAVIYYRGDLGVLERRRVAIVGTRNATAAGRATAHQLGAELAAAGVAVVSGLARGIDAAAHLGVRACAGVPVGVVGSGLDVAYPRRNIDLWEWVAADGVLLSEWPPGTQPEGWRFPLRNRIIAALSELVVVVESRCRGGSLITAHEALQRGVDVMAVPGSPQSRAADGTNELLSDGALVVRSTQDVLDALSLAHGFRGRGLGGDDPGPTGLDGEVLGWCHERPMTLDELVSALDRPVIDVARSIARLEAQGWVRDDSGWFEATRSRLVSR